MGNILHQQIDLQIEPDILSHVQSNGIDRIPNQFKNNKLVTTSDYNSKRSYWQSHQSAENQTSEKNNNHESIRLETVIKQQKERQLHRGIKKETLFTSNIGQKGKSYKKQNSFLQKAFSPWVYKQSSQIKLNWEVLKKIQQLNSENITVSHAVLDILGLQLGRRKQIYYSKQRDHLIVNQYERVIFVQKIEIDESDVFSYMRSDPGIMLSEDEVRNQMVNRLKDVNELIYKWRVFVSRYSLRYGQNRLPIVGIYEVNHSFINLCLRPKLVIYQQLIPFRFSNVSRLTHLQGVYLLEQCLKGFRMLFEVFGSFEINETLVGFNCRGQVKVWISAHYWSNFYNSCSPQLSSHLNHGSDGLKDQKCQEKMVRMLWMVVYKYTLFDQSIINQTNWFRNCTFQKALELVQTHKCSIMRRKTLQSGLVKFVDRLQFVFQTTQPNYLNSQKFGKHQANLRHCLKLDQINRQQTSQVKPAYLKDKKNKFNVESHIKLVTGKQNPCSGNKKKRTSIFDKGYNHTMSNNQNSSRFREPVPQDDVQHKHMYGLLQDQDLQLSQHVTFINIKSVK